MVRLCRNGMRRPSRPTCCCRRGARGTSARLPADNRQRQQHPTFNPFTGHKPRSDSTRARHGRCGDREHARRSRASDRPRRRRMGARDFTGGDDARQPPSPTKGGGPCALPWRNQPTSGKPAPHAPRLLAEPSRPPLHPQSRANPLPPPTGSPQSEPRRARLATRGPTRPRSWRASAPPASPTHMWPVHTESAQPYAPAAHAPRRTSPAVRPVAVRSASRPSTRTPPCPLARSVSDIGCGIDTATQRPLRARVAVAAPPLLGAPFVGVAAPAWLRIGCHRLQAPGASLPLPATPSPSWQACAGWEPKQTWQQCALPNPPLHFPGRELHPRPRGNPCFRKRCRAPLPCAQRVCQPVPSPNLSGGRRRRTEPHRTPTNARSRQSGRRCAKPRQFCPPPPSTSQRRRCCTRPGPRWQPERGQWPGQHRVG